MFWALARMRPLSKVESVTLTARFARRVLKHFEEKCPNDKRPLKAIEAAEAWLANPSLRAAAHAANAAHAAASQATAWAEEKLEQCRIIRGVIDLPPTQRK
jgi:ABC-type sugar transport system substrate-binding protein